MNVCANKHHWYDSFRERRYLRLTANQVQSGPKGSAANIIYNTLEDAKNLTAGVGGSFNYNFIDGNFVCPYTGFLTVHASRIGNLGNRGWTLFISVNGFPIAATRSMDSEPNNAVKDCAITATFPVLQGQSVQVRGSFASTESDPNPQWTISSVPQRNSLIIYYER